MPPSAVVQQDFSKGSNLVTNPYLLGRQQSLLLVNLLLDEHGSLRTRDGTLIQTSSPDAAPTIRPIVKLFDFIKQDGTIHRLAMLKTTGGNQLYNRATDPWTSIGTFTQEEPIPDILTFTNLALIVNGYETPRSYDGTTLAALTSSSGTVPGGAKHHTLHQGFYWLWNTAAASGVVDGPSSLRACDLNNPLSWPNSSQIFIDKDDGDSGFGMGQFTIAETGISPATSQILFKRFSAYQMTGVFGSTNPAFAIQKIKSDMGCIAARTIKFAPGFGLIRLGHRGFALFDGVDDKLISEEIRPLLFGGHDFVPGGLDWATVERSYAVIVPNPPLYVAACPTNGAALDRVFVYDLVRRAWSVLQFANTLATLQAIQNPSTLPSVLGGDYNQGKVRRYFSFDDTDDGTLTGWQVHMKPASGRSPQQNAYFRRAVMKVSSIDAGRQITGLFILGPMGVSGPLEEISGSAVVVPNAVSVTVLGTFDTTYEVKLAPSWLTDFAVVSKIATGFAVQFSVPAPAAGGVIDWTIRKNPIRSPRTIIRTLTLPVSIGSTAPSGLGFGVAPFGISPFGGVIPSPPELDLTYDIGLIGTNARAIISGEGHAHIRGFEWHLAPKPIRRPSVYA